jgi:glycolate oxidase FAD binding subunit
LCLAFLFSARLTRNQLRSLSFDCAKSILVSRISAKQNSRLNNHSKGLLKLVLNETSEFTPATQSELVRFVAANSVGDRKTLCPVGGRTSLRGRSADVNVSLTELSRVIDYPARDMTITVEAGIRVDTLQSMLAAERQRLPIDIPQSGRATLGGALATNTSGPRRFGHGTFRDYVIGVSAVDASGRLFKAGGRVVKNVAGYDICKLMIGSYGTVGIVTQVTLKLRPFTETTAWFIVRVSNYADAEMLLARLLKSESRPVAIDVLDNVAGEHIAAAARIRIDSPGPYLCIAFEGSPHEVQWQLEMIEREMSASGTVLHGRR